MRRSVWPVSALLAALTAVALLGTAASVRPPGVLVEADGPRGAVNRALVDAFYDAVNAAIETGDLTALALQVAPELLAADQPTPDRATGVGLGRRLRALHATLPALRLTVADLAVDGDLAIVRVETATTAPTAFLGLRLVDPPPAWGPVDVLRLAAGRVVAHETGTDGAVLLEPVLAEPRRVPTDLRHGLTVTRVTLAPGATHAAAAADGARLLVLEAGALTIEVDATDTYAAQTARAVLPATGEHLTIPAGVAYAARNAGDAPAVLLDLAVSRLPDPAAEGPGYGGPPGPAERSPDAGVVTSVLAHTQTSALPPGAVVPAVGRATLAPGARLAWAEAAGPILLHVEAGTASLDAGAGRAWVQDGGDRAATLGDDPLAAGAGVLVVAGNAVTLRAGADTPATLLVVTLLPVEAAAAGATPGG